MLLAPLTPLKLNFKRGRKEAFPVVLSIQERISDLMSPPSSKEKHSSAPHKRDRSPPKFSTINVRSVYLSIHRRDSFRGGTFKRLASAKVR